MYRFFNLRRSPLWTCLNPTQLSCSLRLCLNFSNNFFALLSWQFVKQFLSVYWENQSQDQWKRMPTLWLICRLSQHLQVLWSSFQVINRALEAQEVMLASSPKQVFTYSLNYNESIDKATQMATITSTSTTVAWYLRTTHMPKILTTCNKALHSCLIQRPLRLLLKANSYKARQLECSRRLLFQPL